MTGQVNRGFLRQLTTASVAGLPLPPYTLSDEQEMVIGRDPGCQILLEPNQYTIVSRRHAVIRPLHSLRNGLAHWEICDLSSANGTYINGYYLKGCHKLQPGDRIELGQGGPQFIFECPHYNPLAYTPPQTPSKLPALKKTPLVSAGVASYQKPDVTFTQLFPLASTGRDLTHKAFFIPGILTVVFVVLLFAAVGQPAVFNLLLATYLSGAAFFFVYQLCGKPKPLWVLLACALCTSLLLIGPVLPLFILVFRDLLPGKLPNEGEVVNAASLFIRMLFGAGLMEELLKALPVLGAYFLGMIFSSPWRERIGVWEPLDGILLGAASAVGFTLLETLGQYVPEIMDNVTLQAGEGTGQLLGLQLLIPRVLGSVVGHMAYSGYLGYFIGLSILKPSKRWRILGVGYICAATLHALWNATGYVSPLLLAVVGILSYAFLASAILKARVLSPTRSQNFATRFSEH